MKTTIRIRLIVGALLTLVLSSGCSSSRQLDQNIALDALKRGLIAWKSGERPEALLREALEVVFGDVDWDNRSRLVEYRILDTCRNDGVNLHVDVDLVFAVQAKKVRRVTVTYVVATSPKITVFRE